VGTVSSETWGIGVFLDQTTNTIIRLKIGQDHAGWILRSIQGREASFEKDQRTATLALPARSSALSPAKQVLAMGQAGGTWTDGDGQQITAPSATMSQSAASPGPPLLPASTMGQAGGTTWTDGDGQQVTLPPGTTAQSTAAMPGPPLVRRTSGRDLDGWRRAADRTAAREKSQSMATEPMTGSQIGQELN
jgi:hypothetical protein